MSTLKANKYQHVDRTSPSIEINADGSVSIASTVTYEDVTSVDSVGMVTARTGLRATAGGLVVTAGVSTFSDDVVFTGAAANVTWDKSADDLIFNDNAQAKFGTGGDLSISHNATDSTISNQPGGQLDLVADNFRIRSITGDKKFFTASVGTASTIYHNDSAKLTTTTSGISVSNDINVAGIATVAGNLSIADKIIHTGDTNTAIRFSGADTISFETGGDERLSIGATGNANFCGQPPWSVSAGNNRSISLSGATVAGCGILCLGNSAATTNADFDLGQIRIHNGPTEVARIAGETGDSNNDTGMITFDTKANGGALTERMILTADGNLGLGDPIPANFTGYTNLSIHGSTGGAITFGDDGTDEWEIYAGDGIFKIYDRANTAARLSIDANGNVTVGNDGDSGGAPSAGYDELVIEGGNENIGMCFLSPAANNVTQQISFGDSNNNQVGRILYSHASDYMAFHSNNGETFRSTSDNKVLVGHTASHADMHGKIQLAGASSQSIDIARYTANAHPPYLNLFKSRNGTVGGNTATLNGDNCGTITGYGNDGSGFHAVGSLSFHCDEDSANDDMPGRFKISITADGGTTLTERLRIDKNGTMWIQKAQVDTQFDTQAFIRCHPTSTINSDGRTIIFLGTSTAANYGTAMCGYRRGTSGEPTWELRMLNDSITGTQVEEVRNSGYHAILSTESLLNMNTSQDGSGSDYFARGSKNSTTAGGGNDVFWIYEDGDMYNVNGTFSQSSDIKLKENVVDAPSQWNDLKALKVRKFNFKASTGLDTHTQIGMVAQEVETTCPGLIKERVDLQKTTNSDGTVTETDIGEKTKSIKLTVLYMKAVKALQEAMTRIETLETENTDLKTLIKNSSSFAALKASL